MGIDAVDLFELAGAESFVGIEAPDACQKSLPAEDFVKTGDATVELVGGVEEGGIGIGDGDGSREMFRADCGRFQFRLQFNGAAGPHRPVAEEPALDAQGSSGEVVRSQ